MSDPVIGDPPMHDPPTFRLCVECRWYDRDRRHLNPCRFPGVAARAGRDPVHGKELYLESADPRIRNRDGACRDWTPRPRWWVLIGMVLAVSLALAAVIIAATRACASEPIRASGVAYRIDATPRPHPTPDLATLAGMTLVWPSGPGASGQVARCEPATGGAWACSWVTP